MRNTNAVADPLTLTIVAVAAIAIGVFGSNWKPLEVFRKKPPTVELSVLQAKLAEAELASKKALEARDLAAKDERIKLEAQVRAAQSDNLGTQTALKRVAVKTPEVKLAESMATRVSLKLALAIGNLPKDEQDSMVLLIEQALSEKQSEVDEANSKLAVRDAEFRVLTVERDAIKAQIPILEQKAVKATEQAQEVASKVTAKTNEVAKIANELDSEKRASGSMSAAFDSVKTVAIWIAGIWLFLVFVLPGIIKHMATTNPLKPVLRNIAGLSTSPLLYMDAKAKLDASPTP